MSHSKFDHPTALRPTTPESSRTLFLEQAKLRNENARGSTSNIPTYVPIAQSNLLTGLAHVEPTPAPVPRSSSPDFDKCNAVGSMARMGPSRIPACIVKALVTQPPQTEDECPHLYEVIDHYDFDHLVNFLSLTPCLRCRTSYMMRMLSAADRPSAQMFRGTTKAVSDTSASVIDTSEKIAETLETVKGVVQPIALAFDETAGSLRETSDTVNSMFQQYAPKVGEVLDAASKAASAATDTSSHCSSAAKAVERLATSLEKFVDRDNLMSLAKELGTNALLPVANNWGRAAETCIAAIGQIIALFMADSTSLRVVLGMSLMATLHIPTNVVRVLSGAGFSLTPTGQDKDVAIPETVTTALFHAVKNFFTADVPSEIKMQESRMKRLHHAWQFAKTIDQFISALMKALKYTFFTVCEHFGVAPILSGPGRAAWDMAYKWSINVHTLTTGSEQATWIAEDRNRLAVLLLAGKQKEILAALAEASVNPPSFYTKMATSFEATIQRVRIYEQTGAGRKRPLFIEIVSDPAKQKTGFVYGLIRALFKTMGAPYNANQVYPLILSSEFWNGYFGQLCVLIDDWAQDISPEAARLRVNTLIALANDVPYVTNQAALDLKGAIPFTSRFVIMTRNGLPSDTPSIGAQSPEAVISRIDIQIEITEAKNRFIKDPTPESAIELDHYVCTVRQGGRPVRGLVDVGFWEVAAYCQAALELRMSNNKTLFERISMQKGFDEKLANTPVDHSALEHIVMRKLPTAQSGPREIPIQEHLQEEDEVEVPLRSPQRPQNSGPSYVAPPSNNNSRPKTTIEVPEGFKLVSGDEPGVIRIIRAPFPPTGIPEPAPFVAPPTVSQTTAQYPVPTGPVPSIVHAPPSYSEPFSIGKPSSWKYAFKQPPKNPGPAVKSFADFNAAYSNNNVVKGPNITREEFMAAYEEDPVVSPPLAFEAYQSCQGIVWEYYLEKVERKKAQATKQRITTVVKIVAAAVGVVSLAGGAIAAGSAAYSYAQKGRDNRQGQSIWNKDSSLTRIPPNKGQPPARAMTPWGQADYGLMDKIRKNVCRIHLGTRSCYMTFITPTLGLTVRHFFRDYRDGKYQQFWESFELDGPQGSTTIPKGTYIPIYSENDDLLAVQFEKPVQGIADLSNHVPDHFSRAQYVSGVVRVDPKTFSYADAAEASCGYSCRGELVRCSDMFVTQMDNQPGYCGLPYLSQNPKLAKNLIGIHVAGEGAFAFGTSIWRGRLPLAKSQGGTIPTEWMSGNVKFVRQVQPSEKVRIPDKTVLGPSQIWGLYPTHTAPARLKRWHDGTKERSPLLESVQRGFKNEQWCGWDSINDEALKFVMDQIPKHYEERLLTIFEAVNGSLEHPEIGALEEGTSGGYRWAMRRLGQGKRPFFTGPPGQRVPIPELQKAIDDQWTDWMAGKKHQGSPHFLVLKDERRPLEKVQEGKTRNITVLDMATVINEKRIYGSILANVFYQHKALAGASTLGFNPYGRDWDRLIDSLLTGAGNEDPEIFDGDYASMDSSFHEIFLDKTMWAFHTRVGLNKAQSHAVNRSVYIDVEYIVGDIVFTATRNPTGCYMTAELNTTANQTITVSAAIRKAPTIQDHYCYAMKAYKATKNNGDDSLNSKWEGAPEPQEVIAEAHRLGFTLTGADKSAQPRWKKLSEVQYLKRSDRLLSGVHVGVMPLDLILEIPMWCAKSGNKWDNTYQNILAAARELALYGPEVYYRYMEEMTHEFNRRSRHPRTYPSWDSQVSDILQWQKWVPKAQSGNNNAPSKEPAFVFVPTMAVDMNTLNGWAPEDRSKLLPALRTKLLSLLSEEWQHVNYFAKATGLAKKVINSMLYKLEKQGMAEESGGSAQWRLAAPKQQTTAPVAWKPQPKLSPREHIPIETMAWGFRIASEARDKGIDLETLIILLKAVCKQAQAQAGEQTSDVGADKDRQEKDNFAVTPSAPTAFSDLVAKDTTSNISPSPAVFGKDDPYGLQDVSKLMERQYTQYFTVSSANAANTLIVDMRWPDIILQQPFAVDKFTNYTLSRFDVAWEARATANPFVAGKILFATSPEYFPTSTTYGLQDPDDLRTTSMMDCKVLSLQSGGVIGGVMPWIHPRKFWEMNRFLAGANGLTGSCGRLVGRVLHPLYSANTVAATTVEVSVTWWLVNTQVCGLANSVFAAQPEVDVPRSSNKNSNTSFLPKAQGGEQSARSRQMTNENVSTRTSPYGVFQQVLKAGTDIVGVAKTVAGLALSFGMDQPYSTAQAAPMVPKSSSTMCYGSGIDGSTLLALDPVNKVSDDYRIYGDPVDYNDINNLKLLPCITNTVIITTSTSAGVDLLNRTGGYRERIDPRMPVGYSTTALHGVYERDWAGFVAGLGGFVRGGMKYHAMFSCPTTTTARVRFFVMPNGEETLPTAAQAANYVGHVVEIHGDTSFSFTIPWNRPYDWNTVRPISDHRGTSTDWTSSNGRLVMFLESPVSNGGSAATGGTIYCTLWRSGSESMQIARLVGTSLRFSQVTPAAQDGGAVVTSDMRLLFRGAFPGLVPFTETSYSGVQMGEAINSLRDVMHRYVLMNAQPISVGIGLSNSYTINPWYSDAAGDVDVNRGLWPIIQCFHFARGSERFKIVADKKPTTENQVLLIQNYRYSTVAVNDDGPSNCNLGGSGAAILDQGVSNVAEIAIPFYTKTTMWSCYHYTDGVTAEIDDFPAFQVTNVGTTPQYINIFVSSGDDFTLGQPRFVPRVYRTIVDSDHTSAATGRGTKVANRPFLLSDPRVKYDAKDHTRDEWTHVESSPSNQAKLR